MALPITTYTDLTSRTQSKTPGADGQLTLYAQMMPDIFGPVASAQPNLTGADLDFVVMVHPWYSASPENRHAVPRK